MDTAGAMVWCVICVGHDGSDRVHIFSNADNRRKWVEDQEDGADRLYIHYDYVIDDPDRMDKPARSLS
jgi:hypothetical protein